jgi:Holliday junction resolvase RusA-like endonuclease
MDSELVFAIPGDPVPWTSTKQNRHTGNRFLPARQADAVAHTVAFINQRLGGDDHDLVFPQAVPLRLDCTFYVKRPKGHYGTGRNAGVLKGRAPEYPTGKPDLSNLVKMVEDCLVLARVMPDDDQVVEIRRSLKLYVPFGEQPRSVIRIRAVGS